MIMSSPRLRDGYQSRERAFFDRLAQQHDEVWWGHRRPVAPLRMDQRAAYLHQHLASFCKPRVLEVGCGSGIFTLAVLNQKPDLDLTACDISEKATELARKRCAAYPHLRVEAMDVFDSGYADESFDAVVGSSILHHLSVDQFIPLAVRLLKPGGLFWFSEPNMLNPEVALQKQVRFVGIWMDNSPNETAFFRWQMRRDLAVAGLCNITIVPFDFMHPLYPRWALKFARGVNWVLERTPVVREFGGSIRIAAYKP